MSDVEKTEIKPAILILGAPGAGKGTQGIVLGQIPRFYHFACGDVFRQLDTRTELGQKFVEFSRKGELVPDELTIQLWAAHMDSRINSHQYKPDIDILVLDGIPRNVEQARILENHVKIHHVFHLSCPDRDELARRMRKRALKDNRIDDASEDVIQRRIKLYEDETKPILDYYPNEICSEVDATQSPAKVLYDILARLQTLEVYQKIAKLTV
ncbi:nucleoside monophosphate kinase [Akkermansiaceae bacterium]|jgi:adenylate kinase|nr:nucleoside monophosphate kinase [Akkermansiaceae bacterium]MDB4512376.1 nucleoside monophosphate kinase [bacterium]MDA7615479.1 nucleoside monophosphate kinase [Akkermansiaceae bacterium]MDB4687796.1 nucleoside monophosphate kinase [Akkermansiaceae bacterium]MDB4730415.1 nucleoside monophosphate kinase [Akkermansiaceae bacterium]